LTRDDDISSKIAGKKHSSLSSRFIFVLFLFIDEVRIYNRALPDEEIKVLYGATR